MAAFEKSKAVIQFLSIEYLLLGDVLRTLDNPISDLLGKLSPQQRGGALKILQLYSDATGHVDEC